MKVIELKDLNKSYGKEPNVVKAIDNINLEIEKGFTAIVGPSGCGKTTLMQLIGGLRQPDSGKVLIEGTDISFFRKDDKALFRRRNIGFVFREYNLLTELNVYENIIFTLELDGRDVDREYIYQIAYLLKLDDKMDMLPVALSNGERQKVAIARALATKPKVILADEPTGSLDSKASLEVAGLLKMTCREFNQTAILITHDMEIADNAERVIYLRDGKVQKISERRKQI
ncbi:putative ABC transport system ATP-binding protein [Aequitasia blattaphilus]|uniref:ABC transporter ATP-binding protein n=1 Tax=Aequitasia blattaphilus TaxID=2949332 RepID=A0ABT1EBY0_9FIRM|nr:ABC transporter ATP-binding protein [Aequitasia blattaphilus]MCP1103343.1 ABC transporter ATP-binding protein [Aequitasia blattaphilus]MCR8615983.1 ABC transporter ATP-binding protein [Aequitasia blattaphilus]